MKFHFLSEVQISNLFVKVEQFSLFLALLAKGVFFDDTLI